MNKKLLFAAMSLVAFTACTDNDFESQKVAKEVGSVQFEILNNNDAFTRATMNNNTISWSAATGDLFTLYHGGEGDAYTGFQNATYKAEQTASGAAVLSTPSMILEGEAVMVWPVDSTFRITSDKALTIKIPAEQNKVVDIIPYVSDRMAIGQYTGKNYNDNTAGLDRKYTVYMRPIASQLNLKADYDGMDKLNSLATGEDAITPIKVTSVDLFTDAGSEFTTEIPVKWGAANNAVWNTNAATKTLNQTWSAVTDVNIAEIAAGGKVVKLTAKDVTADNTGCTFVLLPQGDITFTGEQNPTADNAEAAAVVVNTTYGKVVVAPNGVQGSKYVGNEANDAWYRFLPANRPENTPDKQWKQEYETRVPGVTNAAGYQKVYTTVANGMAQTINAFNAQTAPAGSKVQGERMGASTTRYVKVLLKYLDMSDLHIKNDKQLRDAARIWKELNLQSVTVYLDGAGTANAFVISQQTIETINTINAGETNRKFTVKPCDVEGEVCDEIVITGGGVIPNLDFILANVPEEQGDQEGPIEPEPEPAAAKKANVVLQTGFNWEWDGTIMVAADAETGIDNIINRGTMANATTEPEGKILNILSSTNPKVLSSIKFKNDVPGKWNITTGTIRVQNEVENFGTLTISKPAQYRQDGNVFTNNALTLENRFIGGSGQRIGKVNNYGVFATINQGVINNYSLIEHLDKDAKTFITTNETAGASFATGFGPVATQQNLNKKGRINLPYENKDEDNISISADEVAPYQGFISVTVTGLPEADNKVLKTSAVGKYVNYMIVKSGVDAIALVPADVEYLEIDTDHEVYWSVEGDADNAFSGLIVLSDVNVKLGTKLNANVTYLGAEMYVGGTFNWDAITQPAPDTNTKWNGYYGNTENRVAEHYVTF